MRPGTRNPSCYAASLGDCSQDVSQEHFMSFALLMGLVADELFALQKADVDFDAGPILVSRSHDRDIPKGGRVEAVPINSELTAYLKKAIAASRAHVLSDEGLAERVLQRCLKGREPGRPL